MSENNPYQAPHDPNDPPRSTEGGSIERALAGDVHWSINGALGDAWEKQNGMKLTFWGAMLMYIVVLAVLGYLLELALGGKGAGAMLAQVVLGLVTYPMAAGFIMMGVKRAAGLPISATMIFDYYGRTLQIFLLYIVCALLILLGYLLLILPGIYLTVAYAMALPLMVEKNLGIWESLETSRKAMTKCWFRYFGLMLLMLVIILISIIPLGLGLIWTMPTLMLVVGVVYRDMFGVEGVDAETAVEHAV